MQPRKTNPQSGWPLVIKIMLDKLVAALLFVVLSPVLLIIAFLVWFPRRPSYLLSPNTSWA